MSPFFASVKDIPLGLADQGPLLFVTLKLVSPPGLLIVILNPIVILEEAARRACLPAQAGIENLFRIFKKEILDIDALTLSVQG